MDSTQPQTTDGPIISAVLSTYNRAHCVGAAIQSVLNQTLPHFELIVVDDGSTDDTADIVNGFSDQRVRLICMPRNSGRSAATNHGARLARGRWLVFVDSDDLCPSTRFKSQLRAAERADADAVFGRTVFMDERGRPAEYFPRRDQLLDGVVTLHKVLSQNLVGTGALMVRRQAFLALGGFDEALFKAEDRDFAIRFVQRFVLLGMDEIVRESQHSPDSLTGQPMPDSLRRVLENNAHAYRLLSPKKLAQHYQTAGREYLLKGQRTDAARMFAISLRLHPGADQRRDFVDIQDAGWSRTCARLYARLLKMATKVGLWKRHR